MTELFKNKMKLDNTPVHRMIFMTIVLPALLVLVSQFKRGGKHAMGLTGYFVWVGIMAVVSTWMMIYDKTVRKIIVDEDSKKLILIIQKRFKKLSRIQFGPDNIEIQEKSESGRRKVKTIKLKQGGTEFSISSEDKGITVEDIETIHKLLIIHYPYLQQ